MSRCGSPQTNDTHPIHSWPVLVQAWPADADDVDARLLGLFENTADKRLPRSGAENGLRAAPLARKAPMTYSVDPNHRQPFAMFLLGFKRQFPWLATVEAGITGLPFELLVFLVVRQRGSNSRISALCGSCILISPSHGWRVSVLLLASSLEGSTRRSPCAIFESALVLALQGRVKCSMSTSESGRRQSKESPVR